LSPSDAVAIATADVEKSAFRAAMASFATGVTIVTTVDPGSGRDVGLTASAFSSLSLDPPLLLVCLDRGADSHGAFAAATTMAISILAEEQVDIAMRFAKSGAEKFTGGTSAGRITSAQLVDGAVAHLECVIQELLPGGDHSIVIGRVLSAEVAAEPWPMIHFNRQFGRCLLS
jgi:flavin reductase ActVB